MVICPDCQKDLNPIGGNWWVCLECPATFQLIKGQCYLGGIAPDPEITGNIGNVPKGQNGGPLKASPGGGLS